MIKRLRTNIICVFDEVEGGQIDVYRPSDTEYQVYLQIYNKNKKKKLWV